MAFKTWNWCNVLFWPYEILNTKFLEYSARRVSHVKYFGRLAFAKQIKLKKNWNLFTYIALHINTWLTSPRFTMDLGLTSHPNDVAPPCKWHTKSTPTLVWGIDPRTCGMVGARASHQTIAPKMCLYPPQPITHEKIAYIVC